MPGGGAAAAEEAKKDGGGEQRRSKAAAAHRGLEKFSVGSTCAHSRCLPSVAGSVLTRHVCRFSPGERGKSVAPPPASLPNTNIDVRPRPTPRAPAAPRLASRQS